MAAVNFYALNEKNVMYSAYYEPFDACIKSSSFVDDAKSKAYFAALSADAKKKYMADSYVERCRQLNIPKKAKAAHAAWKAQTPEQDLITDAYLMIIHIFLAVMVVNLLFTCWYHNSYKNWAAREKIIDDAEKPVILGSEMMVPQQQVEMANIVNKKQEV